MCPKYSDIRFMLVNPTAPEWRIRTGEKPSRLTRIFRFSMHTSLAVASAMPPRVHTRIVDEDVEPVDFNAQVDLVGISCMTFNAHRAYHIADRFRERGVPVILGGYHPTFMPDEAFLHADAVCVGEAEPVLKRMMEDFESGRIKGIYQGEPHDLKNLRRPDRRLLPRGAYVWADSIQASRGCPHACQFCSISAFFGNTYRTRPIDEVVDELRDMRRYILFLDDNITADRDYARELFSRMIPLRKRWFSQANVNIAYDSELVRLAAASGCRALFLGFESISQESLSGWDKEFNNAFDYLSAIKTLHDHGIGVFAGIVFGADHDTPDVFEKTLSFLFDAKVDALQATILTPFPGTPIFSRMEAEGRILDKDWSKYDFSHVVFHPRHMDKDTLKQGHDWVLTRFYSRNRILKRFLSQVGYLSPSSVLMASIPVNVSYRHRLFINRTLLGARSVRVPKQASLRIL